WSWRPGPMCSSPGRRCSGAGRWPTPRPMAPISGRSARRRRRRLADLRALIFDVDGTLAETEEMHRRAFNDAFRAHGLDWHWSREDYARLLRTTGGKERIARFID